MAKRGRKSKFIIIEENKDKIINWKRQGLTDENVYNLLGVSKGLWYEYLQIDKEFHNQIKTARAVLSIDLKNELINQAFKHTLETKKQYIKKDLETGHQVQYTEIISREVDGNIGACHMLLKNIDRDNWKENWDTYELKKLELELRQRIAEEKMF